MERLRAFIKKVGIDESASLFRKTPRTVRAWLYGERTPRPKDGLMIDEVTKSHPAGRVRFTDIYQ